MLDAIFFLNVPMQGAYKLDYKMNYSIFESKWTEERLRNKQHKSRPCQFQYQFQADKQDIKILVTATPAAMKKEGTGTFVEPSNPAEDTTDILSPTDLP